jgi:hypothetical protein
MQMSTSDHTAANTVRTYRDFEFVVLAQRKAKNFDADPVAKNYFDHAHQVDGFMEQYFAAMQRADESPLLTEAGRWDARRLAAQTVDAQLRDWEDKIVKPIRQRIAVAEETARQRATPKTDTEKLLAYLQEKEVRDLARSMNSIDLNARLLNAAHNPRGEDDVFLAAIVNAPKGFAFADEKTIEQLADVRTARASSEADPLRDVLDYLQGSVAFARSVFSEALKGDPLKGDV